MQVPLSILLLEIRSPYQTDHIQFFISIPCWPTELFKQANHTLPQEPRGTSPP